MLQYLFHEKFVQNQHKINYSYFSHTFDNLKTEMKHLFSITKHKRLCWGSNSFINISSGIDLKLCEEETLASIVSDHELKIKHEELPLETF